MSTLERKEFTVKRHLDLFNQTNELAPEGVFDYVAGVVWNRKDGKPNDNGIRIFLCLFPWECNKTVYNL